MLTADAIAELDAAGVEIGAHSHRHTQLDIEDTAHVMSELSKPKQVLEQLLGHEVDLFAYPHGFSNDEVRSMTRTVGYHAAYAVRDAFSPPDDDPFRIARLSVRADTDLRLFRTWLQGGGAPVATRREHLRTKAFRLYRSHRARRGDITGI